ncbi:MAG: hypothetical protein WBV93_08750 [Anaerobacillus sp.]
MRNKEKSESQRTPSMKKILKLSHGLDSMHLYIHSPDGDSYGALKAHAFIAYTNKGIAQTGVEEANPYKIEVE